MKNELFRTRFIIKGIFIPKDQLKNNEIWLIPNEILLKQIGQEFSALVVTEVKGKYSEKDIEKAAGKRILPYIRLLSLLTWATPTLELGGTRTLKSRDMIGEEPYPVNKSVRLRNRLRVSKGFLQSSEKLNLQISELNMRFSFLETASSYSYSAEILREGEDDEFSSRRFIDAAISLESLFNEAPSDIAYKICMRAALLLGLLDCKLDYYKIFDTMKNLYNIRNDIAHGIARKEKDYTLENLNTIRSFARNSLICCYILFLNRRDRYGKESKERFDERD